MKQYSSDTYVTEHGFIDRDGYLVPDVGMPELWILALSTLAMLVLPTVALAMTWKGL